MSLLAYERRRRAIRWLPSGGRPTVWLTVPCCWRKKGGRERSRLIFDYQKGGGKGEGSADVMILFLGREKLSKEGVSRSCMKGRGKKGGNLCGNWGNVGEEVTGVKGIRHSATFKVAVKGGGSEKSFLSPVHKHVPFARGEEGATLIYRRR